MPAKIAPGVSKIAVRGPKTQDGQERPKSRPVRAKSGPRAPSSRQEVKYLKQPQIAKAFLSRTATFHCGDQEQPRASKSGHAYAKSSPRADQSWPRAVKSARRAAKMSTQRPRAAQERPRAQYCKTTQDHPKPGKEWPRAPEDGKKLPPEPGQECPRAPKTIKNLPRAASDPLSSSQTAKNNPIGKPTTHHRNNQQPTCYS